MRLAPRLVSLATRRRAAFSLVETILALGLLAAVLLPLIGILGGSSLRQRHTVERTRAAWVAASVCDRITRTRPGESIRFFRVEENGRAEVIDLGPADLGRRYFLTFDTEGAPLRALSPGDATGGLSRPIDGEACVVEIAFEAPVSPDHEGMLEARVSVESPVEARRQDRRAEVLTTLVSLDP